MVQSPFSPWDIQPEESLELSLTWSLKLSIVWRRTVDMRGSPSDRKGCVWARAKRMPLTH